MCAGYALWTSGRHPSEYGPYVKVTQQKDDVGAALAEQYQPD